MPKVWRLGSRWDQGSKTSREGAGSPHKKCGVGAWATVPKVWRLGSPSSPFHPSLTFQSFITFSASSPFQSFIAFPSIRSSAGLSGRVREQREWFQSCRQNPLFVTPTFLLNSAVWTLSSSLTSIVPDRSLHLLSLFLFQKTVHKFHNHSILKVFNWRDCGLLLFL